MRRWVLALGGGACLLLAWRPLPPGLFWNATASVPVGFYRLTQAAPKVGDLVVFDPPSLTAAWLAEAGWLPRGVPLIKPVAALPGASVCRIGDRLVVDGTALVRVRDHDGAGRLLPQWRGCRKLAADEIFVVSTVEGSFDGRYLGPTPLASVRGVARPVWTWPSSAQVGAP